MNSLAATPTGATVVITHRVRSGKEADYDNWIDEIRPLVQGAPGHVDWQIICPVTWSAIYPLVLGVPVVVAPVMRQLGVAENLFVTTLVVTATVVVLMVYVIMPRYTKWVRRWLYD